MFAECYMRALCENPIIVLNAKNGRLQGVQLLGMQFAEQCCAFDPTGWLSVPFGIGNYVRPVPDWNSVSQHMHTCVLESRPAIQCEAK